MNRGFLLPRFGFRCLTLAFALSKLPKSRLCKAAEVCRDNRRHAALAYGSFQAAEARSVGAEAARYWVAALTKFAAPSCVRFPGNC